jgi:hypothetical protein
MGLFLAVKLFYCSFCFRTWNENPSLALALTAELTRKQVPERSDSENLHSWKRHPRRSSEHYTFQMIYLGFSNQNHFYKKETVLWLTVLYCQTCKTLPAVVWCSLLWNTFILLQMDLYLPQLLFIPGNAVYRNKLAFFQVKFIFGF